MWKMNVKSLFRRRSKSPPDSGSGSASTRELERVFSKFDGDGDGKISAAELAAIFEALGGGLALTDEELSLAMAEADSDGDGLISFEEFADLDVLREGDPTAAMEDLREAFSVFDADRSGSISAEEIARVLRGLGERVSVSQCRKMIEAVDRDGDGMVSFEEFKVMMIGSSPL